MIMNPTRDFVRTSFSALATARVARPSFGSSALQTRAGLPVVSNRAFVAAWMARREKLVAAAQRVKAN